MVFLHFQASLLLVLLNQGFWSCSFCKDLHTTLKWLSLPHSPHFFQYVGHCKCWCPVLQCLHLSPHGAPHAHLWVTCQMVSKSLGSLMLFSTLLCALSASTLCAQINTHSLVASSMFSRVITSLKIISVMSSSFSPPINCAINNLSDSLYSHSATFVCSLPIHSLADLLLFLQRFWYCYKSIIWLWLRFNILLSTENSTFVVLHFSFSSCVKGFISNRPIQPSQFFVTDILSSSLMS